MGYYMGDYYGIASRRAFGDPGFLSFLKGAGRLVGSVLGIGGGGGATKVIERAPALVREAGTRIIPAGRAIIKRGVGIVKKHPVLTAAGAAGALGAAAGAGAEALERRGGRGERRRRMNPYNPRALRRALRRTHAFAKMARKIVRVSHMYKKPRGRFAAGGYGRKKRK